MGPSLYCHGRRKEQARSRAFAPRSPRLNPQRQRQRESQRRLSSMESLRVLILVMLAASRSAAQPDPYCAAGLISRTSCCPTTCGTCGGSGCGDRPGGFTNCCRDSVGASTSASCSTHTPPCRLDISLPLWQSIDTLAVLNVTAVSGQGYSCPNDGCGLFCTNSLCDTVVRVSVNGGTVVDSGVSIDGNDNSPRWDMSYPSICTHSAATVWFRVDDVDYDANCPLICPYVNDPTRPVPATTFTISPYRTNVLGTTAYWGAKSGTLTTRSTTFRWRWTVCGRDEYATGCSGATLQCRSCDSHDTVVNGGCAASMGGFRTGTCGYGVNTYVCGSAAPTAAPIVPTAGLPVEAPTAPTGAPIATASTALTTVSSALAGSGGSSSSGSITVYIAVGATAMCATLVLIIYKRRKGRFEVPEPTHAVHNPTFHPMAVRAPTFRSDDRDTDQRGYDAVYDQVEDVYEVPVPGVPLRHEVIALDESAYVAHTVHDDGYIGVEGSASRPTDC
eukprot:m.334626 g.334626  ORF g.334626 m.334626 type:complete len:503 (-) comp27758_c0_seq7:247-1755(-)